MFIQTAQARAIHCCFLSHCMQGMASRLRRSAPYAATGAASSHALDEPNFSDKEVADHIKRFKIACGQDSGRIFWSLGLNSISISNLGSLISRLHNQSVTPLPHATPPIHIRNTQFSFVHPLLLISIHHIIIHAHTHTILIPQHSHTNHNSIEPCLLFEIILINIGHKTCSWP